MRTRYGYEVESNAGMRQTHLAWTFPHLGHLIPVPTQLCIKLPNLDFDRTYTRISLSTDKRSGTRPERWRGGR